MRCLQLPEMPASSRRLARLDPRRGPRPRCPLVASFSTRPAADALRSRFGDYAGTGHTTAGRPRDRFRGNHPSRVGVERAWLWAAALVWLHWGSPARPRTYGWPPSPGVRRAIHRTVGFCESRQLQTATHRAIDTTAATASIFPHNSRAYPRTTEAPIRRSKASSETASTKTCCHCDLRSSAR